MATVITSPADIVNVALVAIGRKSLIGNLYDGSDAANLCLNVYGQTRDELLRANDYDFARRDMSLTLLKSAPPGGYFPPTVWTTAYPPLPWLYEYAYAADVIKVRSIRPPALFVPNYDPQPVVFSIANDNQLVPAQKVILCNVPNALLTYTGQVTDPATMEASFIELFAAALGRRLAPALASMDAAKLEAGAEQQDAAVSSNTQG